METELQKAGNNAVLVALGSLLGKPLMNPNEGGRHYVLLLNADGSSKVEYLERAEKPNRKKGNVGVDDMASFILATNRYANKSGSMIYASLSPARLVAVLNDNVAQEGNPAWRDHQVHFGLKHSTEYDTWLKGNQVKMAQLEFAYFIDENMADFVSPAGAKMLEIALNFKANRDIRFQSKVGLQDGSVQLSYSDVQQGGGTGAQRALSMPETIRIKVPVWAGLDQKKYEFEAKLRYKVTEGELAINYQLIRPKLVVDQAFKDLIDEVKKGCKDIPLLFGNP